MFTKSEDYINELVFDHIETYSFRGAGFEPTEYEHPYTIDKNGQFHPQSQKTNTFQHDHPIAEQIKQLLQIEIEEHLKFLCAPVFHDIIVFYDRNHQIVSVLNVCLSCFQMEVEKIQLKADYKTYGYLKRLFLELGHEVENPEYNIIDEVEALKLKIKKRK